MARRHRIGVVLLVPPPADRDVDVLRRAVGDADVDRIPPHVTLVPPINVADGAIDDVLASLRDAAAAASRIDVTLGPPATFLPATPVLYLEVGGPGIGSLHALRSAVARGWLDRPSPWSFVPHVTLVDGAPPERISAALVALADVALAVRVTSLHVLTQGDDHVWRPLAEMPFGPPAVVGRGGLELDLRVTERHDLDVDAWASREWRSARRDERPRDLAVTARRHGSVVGVATGWTRGRLANLSELLVAARTRGEGVGSHLLAAFCSAAADRGATQARLRTEAGGPAERFYRERGWLEESRYPGPSPEVDIVQLTRAL